MMSSALKVMRILFDRKLLMFKVFVVLAILLIFKQIGFQSKIKMDRKKIDSDGHYLQFYGYTIISMCDITPKLTELHNYFKTSRIAKYCQPLPVDSYHMTVFNMWSEKENFYPYQFKLGQGVKPEKNMNAMDMLMKPALDKVNKKINTLRNLKKVTLNNFRLNVGSNANAISIRVNIADPEQEAEISSFRKWCGENFDKTDSRLKFHVTLGYWFKERPSDLKRDISLLQQWLNGNLTDIVINKPVPMLCRSMEKFIPYNQAY